VAHIFRSTVEDNLWLQCGISSAVSFVSAINEDQYGMQNRNECIWKISVFKLESEHTFLSDN
jgi:hypothetical protein